LDNLQADQITSRLGRRFALVLLPKAGNGWMRPRYIPPQYPPTRRPEPPPSFDEAKRLIRDGRKEREALPDAARRLRRQERQARTGVPIAAVD
jgi:hypothetical protein